MQARTGASPLVFCYQCGAPSHGRMTADGDYNALCEHLCETCKPSLGPVAQAYVDAAETLEIVRDPVITDIPEPKA